MRAIICAVLLCLATALTAAASTLLGTWRGSLDGEAITLVLRGDGGGSLDGVPIRYQVIGNQLLVEVKGDVLAYTFQQQSEQMTVTGGDLEVPVLFVRGGAAPAVAQPQTAMTPAPQGAMEAAMAGKWCYVASFSANQGGGSQSSRCFNLGADGRYTYESESSMSAYSPGMWGGTSSSAADSGRWSVSGGRITAQSDSGSTNVYALEKRNHPRNRDPMLCLDGDCYVTQYQKAPW